MLFETEVVLVENKEVMQLYVIPQDDSMKIPDMNKLFDNTSLDALLANEC